jgi:hypothetical protein
VIGTDQIGTGRLKSKNVVENGVDADGDDLLNIDIIYKYIFYVKKFKR